MRAIYKKVNENPRIVEIGGSLLELQSIVGGNVETLTIDDDLVMLVNEEGKIKGLEPNITYNNDVICGNILVLQVIEDKFAGIDFQNIEKVMEKLLGINSNITMMCNRKLRRKILTLGGNRRADGVVWNHMRIFGFSVYNKFVILNVIYGRHSVKHQNCFRWRQFCK